MTGGDHIRGVICPIVTPFDAEGRVDFDATGALIDFLIGRGIHCLFVGGSTGEVLFLSMEERKALCEFAVQHVSERVPVIIQTGAATTRATIELTLHARTMGAVAASVLLPYYYRYDEDALLVHYQAVAEAAGDFPLFMYIFPEFTGNDISPTLLRRLCDASPNLVGMKVSNPDLLRFQEYMSVVDSEFIPLFGVDGLMLPALSLGARGQVSGTSNAFPEPFLDLYEAFEAGDMEMARQAQQVINRLRVILKDGRNLAHFKEALALRGVRVGGVRAPMRALTADERLEIARELRSLALI
jgi:4-hydroxy-tetrahydrodipicolinate synthase